MEQQANPLRRLIGVRELADQLGCSTDIVYRKVRTGEWPHTSPTRTYKFSVSDIEQILAIENVQPESARVTRRRKAS